MHQCITDRNLSELMKMLMGRIVKPDVLKQAKDLVNVDLENQEICWIIQRSTLALVETNP